MLMNGEFKDKYGWEANESAIKGIEKRTKQSEIETIERELMRANKNKE